MHWLLFFSAISLLSAPAHTQAQNADQTRRDLYTRCTASMRTKPQSAYRDCKEYLEKYPGDDERRMQYVDTWVSAYEAVLSYIRAIKAVVPPDSTTPWFVYEPDLSLDIPQVTDKGGKHQVEIVRSFEGAGEEALLKRAEAVYPSVDKMVEAVSGDPVYWSKNLPEGDEPLWWAGGNDNVRLTKVVTARAVRYYYDLSQGLRSNPKFVTGFPMMSTSLKYVAAIKHYDEYTHAKEKFTDVYVADLNLEWSHICGGLCGMGFKRNKVVVLDSGGNVVALFLDAPENSSMWVS